MVFQVATPALLRDRAIGRGRIEFIRRARTAERATQLKTIATGRVTVSTPEVTVLDLIESPSLGGGMSNVATIVAGAEFVILEPRRDRSGERNARWHLVVNSELEPDL
jgi:predicted transcriptional regulator of viral defense system